MLDQFQALFRGFGVKQLDTLINMLKPLFLDEEHPYFFILSGGEQTAFLAALETAMPQHHMSTCISTRISEEEMEKEWAAYCERATKLFGRKGVSKEKMQNARKNVCLVRGFFCLANVDQLLMGNTDNNNNNTLASMCSGIIQAYQQDLLYTPMYWKAQSRLCDMDDGVNFKASGLEEVVVRVPCRIEKDGNCYFYVDTLFCHFLSQMLGHDGNNVLWKHAGQCLFLTLPFMCISYRVYVTSLCG